MAVPRGEQSDWFDRPPSGPPLPLALLHSIRPGDEPRFPETPRDAELFLTRRHTIDAVVATPAEIAGIAGLITAALRKHFDDHSAELVGTAKYMVENGYRVDEVVVERDDRKRTGPVEASLAEANLPAVVSIELGTTYVRAEEERLPVAWVSLGKTQSWRSRRVDSLSLEVAAHDREWVAATFDRLQEAVDRLEPKWAFMRSKLGTALLWFCTLALVALVSIAIDLRNGSLTAWPLTATIFAWIPTQLWVGLLKAKVLKPFQVVRDGEKSSAAVVAIAVAQVLGVVAAIVTIVATLL